MATAPVDIPVRIKGLSDLQKLERRMEALEREVTRLQKAAQGTGKALPAVGRGAKGAAGGVRAFGAAVKSALGPITVALSAIGGLGAAFNTIKGQDFSEAKFESLGGNADQLVTNLKAVSNELQGTASVAELTGAAYDVASAGFSSAAEASLVLKAASLGATGGFSDLNTVANATTSVLNAYGKSAADAGKLVDQFIQTQNDGKIVVGQYADNIGKVASAAAGLKIPLSEVNAVIAQATASGVNAEVAFTGLKGALARLASGQASKELEQFGIRIDAASIEADGLLGTLKKLEGIDTGTLFKALGTEAAPALLPVIQDLEKYEELIRNQKDANGVAAKAAATAAGTIEGAWKRVTIAFQNLFSDQTELGQLIRGTLLAAAATVEALAAAFKLLVAPIRAVIEVIGGIVSAMTGVEDAESVLQSFTAKWFEVMQAVEDFSQTVIAVGRVIGQYLGALITKVAGWFSELWTGIANGAQGVIQPIVGAFQRAFQFVKGLIDAFWNALPQWLKDALGGIGGNIQGVLDKIIQDVQNAKAEVQINVPSSAGGGNGGGNGGGGGGGAGGGSAATDELKKQREELERQFEAGEKIKQNLERQMQLLSASSDYEKDRLRIAHDLEDTIEQIQKSAAPAQQEGLIMSAEELARIKEAEAFLKELERQKAEAEKNKPEPGKIESYIQQLEADLNDTEGMIVSLAQTVESELASAMSNAITGIIDGTQTAEEAFATMFKNIGKAFIDMATQMIAKALIMKALGILFPGASAGTSVGGGLTGSSGGWTLPGAAVPKTGGMSFFASGGYITEPTMGMIGEGGDSEYVIPEDKMSSALQRYNAGARGDAVIEGANGVGEDDSSAWMDSPINITTGPVMAFEGKNYVTQDEFAAGVQSAAKQGEARALRKLQMSPAARRRAGVS